MPGKRGPETKKILSGRYRIEGTLGKGAGGTVHAVVDLQEGDKPLALKWVEIPKKGETPLLEDLKNEFATLSLLSHPNLAQVYDFGSTEKAVYFSSEYVDGRDILEATREADLNTVFHLIDQILRALDYLHQRGVLHLDLKPANILVTDPDRTGELTVKLIVFGIAQWKKHGRIQIGEFYGTPPYAAPEIAQEKEPVPASDIYSLGMILHQIFTGRFPFPNQDPLQILMRQTTQDPERVERLDSALPKDFAKLLHRMVAREAADRFSSARELLEAINQSLGENFGLRTSRAPARILEESDHWFHPELLEELRKLLSGKERTRIELRGAHGSGKTRGTERVKELLQLQGARPLYFRGSRAARDYLEQTRAEDERALLLDLEENPTGELSEAIRTYSGPVLGPVLEKGEGLEGAKLRRLVIPDLDEEKLSRLFREEIRNAPEWAPGKILESFVPLLPSTLADLLQALREEGRLIWGPSGWSWQGEEPVNFTELRVRQDARVAGRKKTVRDFLESSGLAFPADVLEGMLGLERGALTDSLLAWLNEGWLSCRVQQGVPYLQATSRTGTEPASQLLLRDPEGLAKQLQILYDQGKFSAGVAWADLLERERPGLTLPPGVKLRVARHLMAGGKFQRALDQLPGTVPRDPRERGLYHEIRGRALHRLGRYPEAEAEARLSEAAYREGQDSSGLARAINIFGSLALDQNRFVEAEGFFHKAIETALRVEDFYNAGIIQSNLALGYQQQGKIDTALQAFERAWEFAKKSKNPFFLQVLYHNWVILLYYMGKAADAEQACFEWLKLALENGARDQQAFAFNSLALLAGRKQHFEQQRSYLDQAIALLEPSRSPRLAAQMRVNRAFLYWSEGKFLPAQLDAEAALQLAGPLPDDPIMALVFLTLGMVYRDREQHDYARADGFLQDALERVQRQQNRPLLWEVQFHRGLLAKARGRRELAKECLGLAERALQDMLSGMSEPMRQSYLRDRKGERIQVELAELERDNP